MKARPIHLVAAVTLAIGAVGMLLATMSANAASLSAPSITWTDNFSSSSLDGRWSWIREDATHWSLTERPGFLRITTQDGGLFGPGGDAKNILLQSAPPGDFEIRTRVIFTPTENFHLAGLLVYDDDDNYILLIRGFCSFCIGSGVYFDSETGGINAPSIAETVSVTDIYLRIEKAGAVYTASYSEDGNSWRELGSHTNSSLTPTKIGISASNGNPPGGAELPADFDFFTLIDNSIHLFLPLILK